MSHVDEGTLHALVDDALPPEERDAVQAHLASCGDCARRFAEATAMARQVMTLLGALDAEPAARVRVVAPASVPAPSVTAVTPLRARMVTLRRVAIAASVMLVAGVSYQVGRQKDAAVSAVAESAPPAPKRTGAAVATPSLVEAPSGPSDPSAVPMPASRLATRGGPRAEAEQVVERDAVAAGAGNAAPAAAPVLAVPTPALAALPEASRQVAMEQAQQAAGRTDQAAERRARVAEAHAEPVVGEAVPSQRAQAGQGRVVASQDAAAPAPESQARKMSAPVQATAANASVAAAKAVAIPGYTATEEASQPAIIRRRYVSPAGTPLLLQIMQAPSASKPQGARSESAEFVVSTSNGRSTVRWQRDGRSYELQGALAPDSLVKLATLLK
ncbi:MAG: zf-HC2 domain-containing protein [Gemmatimonadaceae bacterium]|nr:zf-HC2 domain-containing protein [Gemmatimonadaceae bacterium]